MEHKVQFHAGYDCINFECKFNSSKCIPYEGGSHGCHGVNIIFSSGGDRGVITFVLSTGWLPQKVERDKYGVLNLKPYTRNIDLYPQPMELSYHSKKRIYKYQSVNDNCEFLGSAKCYYAKSILNAKDAMYSLVNAGEEGLWRFMDAYYEHVFNGKDYPKPEEYQMSERG